MHAFKAAPETLTPPTHFHSEFSCHFIAGSHKAGDDEWGCISRCVECKNTLVSAALLEGAKIFVIVQASGRIITRYHCPHKVNGKFVCGVAGTCNIPVASLEGARALKIECDKLVTKLESGSSDVVFLLKENNKIELLAKYRKSSVKHSSTIARIVSNSGSVVEVDDELEEELDMA